MSSYAQQLASLQAAILEKGKSSPPLQAHPRMSASQQIDIYAEGYRVRLTNLLLNSYPATLHLMGEQPFRALASRYVEQTPSRVRNIDRYALPFADFLAEKSQDKSVTSLATLEQATNEVFLLPDCQPMTAEDFQTLSEQGLEESSIALRKSAQLLATPHNAHDYLTAFRSEQAPPKIANTPAYCLLYRHNRQVQREILSFQDYQFLHYLHQGETLGSALEKLSQASENFDIHPAWLQKIFQKAIEKGYFSTSET